jgi:hypothetical protein
MPPKAASVALATAALVITAAIGRRSLELISSFGD